MDAYLSVRPELVPYAPFMHPDRALALGLENPFLIFPRGFFEDHSPYDQECQRNIHNNQVKLKSLGLVQGNVEAFLHGIVWDVTDRRVVARENKKMETQRPREEQRVVRKAERQERLKETRRARCTAEAAKKKMVASIDDLPDPMALVLDDYYALPWCRGTPPLGLLTYPGTKDPVLVQHLPESIVDALMDIVDEILTRYGEIDPVTEEQMYVHVGRYRARYGSAIFSGWQVQRRIPCASTVYLARTWESILGALIAAASYMDSRITSLASAHSWVLWLVECGEPSATTWLTSVRYALENWRANIKVRAQGGGRRRA